MKACKMLYISIFRRSPLKMVGVYLARITFRCKNYYILLYSLTIKYITVLVMVLSNKRATKM